jgi:hypothetical protein
MSEAMIPTDVASRVPSGCMLKPSRAEAAAGTSTFPTSLSLPVVT